MDKLDVVFDPRIGETVTGTSNRHRPHQPVAKFQNGGSDCSNILVHFLAGDHVSVSANRSTLHYRLINRNASEKNRLLVGRLMIGLIVGIAGYFGINPPGFVAQVVAFAFGLAASSFFPVIVLGIFSKRVNREGAICGMITGISFTIFYIVHNKYLGGSPWFLGISAEGIGTVGMVINFLVTLLVSRFTAPPPAEVQEMVDNIRFPRGAGAGIDH